MLEFNYDIDYKNTLFVPNDYRYRIGRGEQGVLLVRPYTDDICKNWKFSRPALLMSYILFPRLEEGYLQLTGVFFWDDFDAIALWWNKGDTTLLSEHWILNNAMWLQHPMLPICMIIAVALLIYGFFNKTRQMDYA